MSDPTKGPLYNPGNVIASNLYMGTVKGAFWSDGEWNYIIGDNADTDTTDKEIGYRIGSKFIKHSNVRWYLLAGSWSRTYE